MAIVCLIWAPIEGGAIPSPSATARAAEWILAHQNPDGTLFEATYPSDGQAEAAASLISAGASDERTERLLNSIERNGQTRTGDAGWTSRIVAGLAAGGRDPHNAGGYDYVSKLTSFYDAASGAYDQRIYADALAIIGLVAAREKVPSKATEYLRANQCASGGFFHDPGCAGPADIDTTAIVISALVASGVDRADLAVQRARTFLVGSRNTDGGFGLGPQGTTNANSTGLALSAIAALGERPEMEPWTSSDGRGPVRALLSLQVASGGFRYRADSPDANRYATIQAIPGLSGHPYPISPIQGRQTRGPIHQPAQGSASPDPATPSNGTPKNGTGRDQVEPAEAPGAHADVRIESVFQEPATGFDGSTRSSTALTATSLTLSAAVLTMLFARLRWGRRP